MFIAKFIIVVQTILVAVVIDVAVDRTLGINLSAVSIPRMVIHNVALKLTGVMIAAVIWLV